MSSTIVAVISDTHIGSTTALAPPKFTIHTGRHAETQIAIANQYQAWLYECWKDYWLHVLYLAGIRGKYRKNRLIIVHLGDVVDSVHHGTPQVMNEMQDQIDAACNLLRPIFNLADAVYLTYGTGAHNGGASEHEMNIGNELGIIHDYEFAPLVIDDVAFDLTHHGRAGRRDWTSAGAGLASEVALDYVKNGKLPPRYVLRGHSHTIDDSGFKLPYTRAISLPSWQLRTAYGHMVSANQKWVDIGGISFDTSKPEQVDFSRIRYRLPNTRKEYQA